jgi:UDP-N-acetylglucosamine transferase subunit ALG13
VTVQTLTPLVLVAVGTDVHPFDRLIDWVQRWRGDARMVVQYGQSRPPEQAGGQPFLGHAELQRTMADAALVVCHGGPATITEARRNGHVPIVVPRDPSRYEHVDNHQQLFARRLGAAGMVRLCESESEFVAALDLGVADPSAFALGSDVDAMSHRTAAADRVGQVVDGLVRQRSRRLPWFTAGPAR